MDITFDRRTVDQCLQQRFALPSYQRDYKWEVKHLQELLTDVQEAFFASYRAQHGRGEVANYTPYFLGTIITTPAENGLRAIVDGQQRITTLAMLIAYYCRLASENPNLEISDIAKLLRQKIYGQTEFNISFAPARKDMFEIFVGPRCDGQDIEERIESIQDLDHGSRQIYNLYRDIENFVSDKMTDRVVPYFVDYITQCVYLFEIGVPTEQDGHKVFVTMNDRGLKLSPIDLLKGYLLSNIRDAQSNRSAHQNWNEIIGTLKSFGNDEDSAFFKTMLRAKYAESIRGKNKGDTPGDFEIIGDSYHRWVADNKVSLGLNTADDFSDFLSKHLPNSVHYYATIRKAEETFSGNFPHVFYNAARGLTLQTMLILASINAEDTAQIVSQKIRAISYYLDFYATSRILSGQDNTYDNIRDPIFQLVKSYRRKSIYDLRDIIKRSIESYDMGVLVRNVKFNLIKRRDLLHLLARIATYLENELELTNNVGFPAYIDRNQGNRSFDVEHIISNTQEIIYRESPRVILTTSTIYTRDVIGGLILLPRSRNRSLQAKSYQAKVGVYQTENVLAQTLCTSLYTNNPAVIRFISNTGILLKPISEFTADSMEERGELYAEIARKIWGTSAFLTAIDETADSTAMENFSNL